MLLELASSRMHSGADAVMLISLLLELETRYMPLPPPEAVAVMLERLLLELEIMEMPYNEVEVAVRSARTMLELESSPMP